jgi:hypothetical protein
MPLVRNVLEPSDQPRELRHCDRPSPVKVPTPPLGVYVDGNEFDWLVESAPPATQSALFLKKEALYVYVYPKGDNRGLGVAHTRLRCRVATSRPRADFEWVGWLCPICRQSVSLSTEPCPHCLHRSTLQRQFVATWL